MPRFVQAFVIFETHTPFPLLYIDTKGTFSPFYYLCDKIGFGVMHVTKRKDV